MTLKSLITSIDRSSDIYDLLKTSSMLLSAKTEDRLTANLSEKDVYLQRKQKVKRSTANLNAILQLIEVELQLETDEEIHAALAN